MVQLQAEQSEYQVNSYFYWAAEGSLGALHCGGSSFDNLLILGGQQASISAAAEQPGPAPKQPPACKPCRSEAEEQAQPAMPAQPAQPGLHPAPGAAPKDCEGYRSTGYYSHAVHFHAEAPAPEEEEPPRMAALY